MTPSRRRSNSKSAKKITLSWANYENLIVELCSKIKRAPIMFSSIYGIPRGGAILSNIMSHVLNIPVMPIEPIEPIESLIPIEPVGDYNILVVDDISDTGKTLQKYVNFYTATLFKHKKSRFIPDFFVEENNQWINFPYEGIKT